MNDKKEKTSERSNVFNERQLYGLSDSDSTYTDDQSIGPTRNHIFTKPDVRKTKLRPSIIARYFRPDNLITSTPMHFVKNNPLDISPIDKDSEPEAAKSRLDKQSDVLPNERAVGTKGNIDACDDLTLINQEDDADKLKADAAERLYGKEVPIVSVERCKNCRNAVDDNADVGVASNKFKNRVLRKRNISRSSRKDRSKRHAMVMRSRIYTYLKSFVDQLYTESSEMDDSSERTVKPKQKAPHLRTRPKDISLTSSMREDVTDNSRGNSYIYNISVDTPTVDTNFNCSDNPIPYQCKQNQDRKSQFKTKERNIGIGKTVVEDKDNRHNVELAGDRRSQNKNKRMKSTKEALLNNCQQTQTSLVGDGNIYKTPVLPDQSKSLKTNSERAKETDETPLKNVGDKKGRRNSRRDRIQDQRKSSTTKTLKPICHQTEQGKGSIVGYVEDEEVHKQDEKKTRQSHSVQDRRKCYKATKQECVADNSVHLVKRSCERSKGNAKKVDLSQNYRNYQMETSIPSINCNAAKDNVDVGSPDSMQSKSKMRKVCQDISRSKNQDSSKISVVLEREKDDSCDVTRQNTSAIRTAHTSIGDLLKEIIVINNNQPDNKTHDKRAKDTEAAVLEDTLTGPKTKTQRSFVGDGQDKENDNNSDQRNSYQKGRRKSNLDINEWARRHIELLQTSVCSPNAIGQSFVIDAEEVEKTGEQVEKYAEHFDPFENEHCETRNQESIANDNPVVPKRGKRSEKDCRSKSDGKDVVKSCQRTKENVNNSTSLINGNVVKENIGGTLSQGRGSKRNTRKVSRGNNQYVLRSKVQDSLFNEDVAVPSKDNSENVLPKKLQQNTRRTMNQQSSFRELLQEQNIAEINDQQANKSQDCRYDEVTSKNTDNCDMLEDSLRRPKTQKLNVSHSQVQKLLFKGDMSKRTKKSMSLRGYQTENSKTNVQQQLYLSGISMHPNFGDSDDNLLISQENTSTLQQSCCGSDEQTCNRKLVVEVTNIALSTTQLKKYINSVQSVELNQTSFIDTRCITPTEQSSIQRHQFSSNLQTPKQTKDSQTNDLNGRSSKQNCPILNDDEMISNNVMQVSKSKGKKDRRRQRLNNQQKVIEDIQIAPSNGDVENEKLGNVGIIACEMKDQNDDKVFKKPFPVKSRRNTKSSSNVASSESFSGVRKSTRTRKPNHLNDPLPYLVIVVENTEKSKKRTKGIGKKSDTKSSSSINVDETSGGKARKKHSKDSRLQSDEYNSCTTGNTTLLPNSLEQTFGEERNRMSILSEELSVRETSSKESWSNTEISKARSKESNYSTFMINDEVCKVCWVNDMDDFRQDPVNPSMLVSPGVNAPNAGVYSGSLILKPNGQKLPQVSLKYSTSFFVHKGQAEVTVNDCCRAITVGNSFCVPIGTTYSLRNPSLKNDLCLFYSKSRQLHSKKK